MLLEDHPGGLADSPHERPVEHGTRDGAHSRDALEELELKEERQQLFGDEPLLIFLDEQVLDLAELVEPPWRTSSEPAIAAIRTPRTNGRSLGRSSGYP